VLVALAAATAALAAPQPLAGRTVVLDPGHNGANARAPQRIARRVPVGGGRRKACDTTGTASARGEAESALTWDVSRRAGALLRARGARVVLTRRSDDGVGPCIDERARIGNRARADAAVSVHADGGPASGRGFHVIVPARITGLTDDIAAPSRRLGLALRGAFARATGLPRSTYAGREGLAVRGDLGGLRLSDVPKVFLEMGNMRNARDAARLRGTRNRDRLARGIADGVAAFLERRRTSSASLARRSPATSLHT